MSDFKSGDQTCVKFSDSPKSGFVETLVYTDKPTSIAILKANIEFVIIEILSEVWNQWANIFRKNDVKEELHEFINENF